MIKMRYTCAIVLSLLVFLLGAVTADAGKGGGRKPPPTPNYTNAPPCVMTDFSRLPGAAIYDPITGEIVKAGRTYTINYGANSGIWLGDPTFGALLGVQLWVDDSLSSSLDLSGGSIGPLPWPSPTVGQHELVLRAYLTDFYKTRTCFVDSLPQYPIVQ